jgi:hypothetical protein
MVAAVPADAAQAVMRPDEPATRVMIVIGVVVVGIIRVVAAADKEVAMMMVEEATVMEATAREMRSAAVPPASAPMERMKAAAMETAAVETASAMKATAAVEAATTMKAAAAMSATMDFGHEPVGCAFGRRDGLRCHERHRCRGPAWRHDQNQQRRRKAEKAEPPICNRRHAWFSLRAGKEQRSATSTMLARCSPADLRDHPEY